ncbi:MAG: hypothetical protein DHS80DRAFT_32165 [Piptocephalis tieghemiana]|nr:MAG: hypothetical protein DHS80DRAFT_32165 [Piptocephalis tieghemiana]
MDMLRTQSIYPYDSSRQGLRIMIIVLESISITTVTLFLLVGVVVTWWHPATLGYTSIRLILYNVVATLVLSSVTLALADLPLMSQAIPWLRWIYVSTALLTVTFYACSAFNLLLLFKHGKATLKWWQELLGFIILPVILCFLFAAFPLIFNVYNEDSDRTFPWLLPLRRDTVGWIWAFYAGPLIFIVSLSTYFSIRVLVYLRQMENALRDTSFSEKEEEEEEENEATIPQSRRSSYGLIPSSLLTGSRGSYDPLCRRFSSVSSPFGGSMPSFRPSSILSGVPVNQESRSAPSSPSSFPPASPFSALTVPTTSFPPLRPSVAARVSALISSMTNKPHPMGSPDHHMSFPPSRRPSLLENQVYSTSRSSWAGRQSVSQYNSHPISATVSHPMHSLSTTSIHPFSQKPQSHRTLATVKLAKRRVVVYPLLPLAVNVMNIAFISDASAHQNPRFSLAYIAFIFLSLQGFFAVCIVMACDPSIHRVRDKIKSELINRYVIQYNVLQEMNMDLLVHYKRPRVAKAMNWLLSPKYPREREFQQSCFHYSYPPSPSSACDLPMNVDHVTGQSPRSTLTPEALDTLTMDPSLLPVMEQREDEEQDHFPSPPVLSRSPTTWSV